jgi:hypothetical protein
MDRPNLSFRVWSNAVALALLVGCGVQPSRPEPAEVSAKADAESVLREMVDAYRSAASYCDRGVLRLSFRRDGQRFEDKSPFSVRAQGPNRIAVRAYQARVTCDGASFVARILDPATEDIDGQVLVAEAPVALDLEYLYRDSVLRDALTSGLGRLPVQLELLYGEQPLEALFHEEARTRLLAPGDFDGQTCYRVRATTGEGDFVFWIDRESFVLRRLEYPVNRLLPQLGQEGNIEDAVLIAEFSAARLNHGLPKASFACEIPDNARQVQYFVLPPQPLPSELLAKQPEEFAFTTLRGERVDAACLRGNHAVLTWFHDHPVCRTYLQQLEAVYQSYASRDGFRFYAVCTEGASRSNASVERMLENWRVTVPVVRDLEAFGRDVFRIPWAPSLVVLDRQGTVQAFEVGANPDLGQQLPMLLEQLASGESVAENTLATYRQAEQTYARLLAAAQGDSASSGQTVAAGIAVATQPRRLRLTPLWHCDEANHPGNLLVTSSSSGDSRILALDGRDRLLDFDISGKVRARRQLKVDDPGITLLKTAVDSQGSRFYVGASMDGERAFVFDHTFQRVGVYPPAASLQGPVADATLIDVDRDGQLELVLGFRQTAGVHCATLEGARKWENRQMPDVLSVAGEDRLFVSGQRGDVIPFDELGRPERPLIVPGRAVFHLYVAQYHPQKTAYCGLTFDDEGRLLALGLDAGFRETWEYELPGGLYQDPVQFVTSGTWTSSGQGVWAFAGSDGTLHVVREDGTLEESFATGRRITGLVLLREADRDYLFLAGRQRIHAWHVRDVQPHYRGLTASVPP